MDNGEVVARLFRISIQLTRRRALASPAMQADLVPTNYPAPLGRSAAVAYRGQVGECTVLIEAQIASLPI